MCTQNPSFLSSAGCWRESACVHGVSAPTYISWGKGTSQTPTVTTLFLFPSRGASVLRAELQQCQLQHQQRQLAHPAPSLPALRTPGAAVRLPTAKSGTAQGVLSSLWLLGGVNDTSRPGLFTSLSKKRRGKKPKRAARATCVCAGEVWETEPSPAAAPRTGFAPGTPAAAACV